MINLISSIGSFVMAIGFALVLIDVVVHALLASAGRAIPGGRNARMGDADAAAAYNFASLPHGVADRDPLATDPGLAVKLHAANFILASRAASCARR